MKKERLFNLFDATIVDDKHVRFLATTFEYDNAGQFEAGAEVKVKVDFRDVNLQDNEEEGELSGVVTFILYKGNHYHLTVATETDENIYVDTNDVWDDGDRVGISIPRESIKIEIL